jgi:hypothetical protein
VIRQRQCTRCIDSACSSEITQHEDRTQHTKKTEPKEQINEKLHNTLHRVFNNNNSKMEQKTLVNKEGEVRKKPTKAGPE